MKILIMNSARKFIGEAAHCLNLAGELRQRGHEAMLVVRSGYELESYAQKEGVPCHSLAMLGHFHPVMDWRDHRKLRRLIADFQPDIVHCHRGKDHWLAAAALFSNSRIPLVRTRHVVTPMRQHIFNWWLFSRRTAEVIAVSERAERSLGPMRAVLGRKLTVIHSAVNSARFSPDKRNLDWRRGREVADDAPLIGIVARIQNIKGQHILIDAAPDVVKEYPNVRFLVAGSGSPPRVDRLRRQAARLGVLDNFIFEGWLERVETAIASFDIGIVASLGSEGSSRVTLECMASGVPIVATAVGGIPEIITDRETGLIVEPGNPQKLAAAIKDYLSHPELARRVTKNALSRARNYHSVDRWIHDVLAVFSKALTEKGHK